MCYSVAVPSLNKQATLHSVVADFRHSLDIYDPNKGVEEMLYYSYATQDGIELKYYVIDAIITAKFFEKYHCMR